MSKEGSGVAILDPGVLVGEDSPTEPSRVTNPQVLTEQPPDPVETEGTEGNYGTNEEEEVFLSSEGVNPPVQVCTVRENESTESEAKEELKPEIEPPVVTTTLLLTTLSTAHSLPPRRFSILDDAPMRQTRRAELRDARAQSFGITTMIAMSI